MKRIIKFVLAAALLVNSLCLNAASWYQIEVIVFDYLHPDLDGEIWFENPGLPSRDRTVELVFDLSATPPATPVALPRSDSVPAAAGDQQGLPLAVAAPKPTPYKVLPVDRYHLRDDLRRLQLSSSYRPLLHIAWQQPGLGNSRSRYVHLLQQAGGDLTPEPVEPPSPTPDDAVNDLPPPAPVLDGLIRLRSMNVLLLDVDFAYFPQDLARIIAAQPGAAHTNEQALDKLADYVRLSESKRILLNELNYFDHPLFGVLVQVSRISREDLLPKPAQPVAPGTAPTARIE